MESATLSGAIHDPKGGVVANAEVVVSRIETGTVATTKTNEINQSLPPNSQIQLSPGDLDEAVSAFLQLSKADAQAAGESTAGTAFQHLTAFRTGFFAAFNDGLVSGLKTCLSGAAASEASSS